MEEVKKSFEGFVFSKKGATGATHSPKDVGMSLVKASNGTDRRRVSIILRNGVKELIIDNKKYIRFGMKGALFYFLPTNDRLDGYTFRQTKGCTNDNSYSTMAVEALPGVDKYLENVKNMELRYDKTLELYYVDSEEETDE